MHDEHITVEKSRSMHCPWRGRLALSAERPPRALSRHKHVRIVAHALAIIATKGDKRRCAIWQSNCGGRVTRTRREDLVVHAPGR